MPRLVKYPLTNSEVKLADFKDRVDAGDHERFEALMWEETEGLVDLGTTTSTSAPGEYTKKPSMKALLQLLSHAERGLQELGLDRMVTDGRNKGMTSCGAFIQGYELAKNREARLPRAQQTRTWPRAERPSNSGGGPPFLLTLL